MANIIIEKCNCFYEQRYQGNNPKPETIVFIHGAGGNHKLWYYQTKELSNHFYIICPDLPGHGKSTGNACHNISDYSSFISKLIDATGKNPVYVAGHSMGGAIAMHLALKCPQKIKGLILIGTGSRLRVAPQILETFKNGQYFWKLIKYFFRQDPPQTLLDFAKEDMISTDPGVWFADFTACNNFDITGELNNIKNPTLVIGADEDILTPPKYSRLLSKNLPQAIMELISRAGHMMMLEKPDSINRAILNFVKGDKNVQPS